MSESQVLPASISPKMLAVRLHPPGGPPSLICEELDTPQPGPGQVLVRVHAAAITRGELDWPVDRLPAIPSYEVSGVVVSAAPDVANLAIGDSIFALLPFDRDGAAAEYAALPSDSAAPKPHTLSHVESAAVPLAGLSGWQGLFDHGRLEQHQTVLIHGAAGGVGSLAVQIAHSRGAVVIATSSTANVETARRLGADRVIDYTRTRFDDAVENVDLVFDTVGGELLQKSPRVLRDGGRLVSVAEEPPSEGAASKGFTGAYFVVRPDRTQLAELAALIELGALRPIIDEVYSLTEARSAFERSLGRHGPGKIVLRLLDE